MKKLNEEPSREKRKARKRDTLGILLFLGSTSYPKKKIDTRERSEDWGQPTGRFRRQGGRCRRMHRRLDKGNQRPAGGKSEAEKRWDVC